jgi:lactoylglutathione lyase
MKLAKRHLDIGLFSNKRDEQLAFWQQTIGLPYDHVGKLGSGVQQHRHHMNGSILKMNHARDPLPALASSGIVGLQIAREGLAEPKALADPDGNKVTLVPAGRDGVMGVAILLKVTDPAAHDRF